MYHKHGFSGPFFYVVIKKSSNDNIFYSKLIEKLQWEFHYFYQNKLSFSWQLESKRTRKKEPENPGHNWSISRYYCFFSVMYYSFKAGKISHDTNKKLVWYVTLLVSAVFYLECSRLLSLNHWAVNEILLDSWLHEEFLKLLAN